jgi:hypothetical protein
LDGIFGGTDDVAFNAAKSPWGTDIKPGIVRGTRAAVVEHPDPEKVLPPDSTLKRTQPDDIVDYLVTVFEANQAWQRLR